MKNFCVIFLLFFCKMIFSQNYFVDTLLIYLNQPVDFAMVPNTSKVFVNIKGGDMGLYDYNSGTLLSVFWKLEDSLLNVNEFGLLGVCLDPDYSSNHYVYSFYQHSYPPNSNQNLKTRLVRFTDVNNYGTDPKIILDIPATEYTTIHAGGIIKFNPLDPGKIFAFIGNHANNLNSQALNNPYGKMIRINKDGTIPNDNPFYDDGNPLTGNDDRIWSYGHRNSFGFCFGPDGKLYESENGANYYDECNYIVAGKNYGWNLCEGYCEPHNPLYKQPMAVFTPFGGLPALTGIIYYNSNTMPWLNNKLIIASSSSNSVSYLYQCELNPAMDSIISKSMMLNYKSITSLTMGNDGYIYALLGGYTGNGKFFRIRPNLTGINIQHFPAGYSLSQNYPNPFNPVTSIKYEIPISSLVTLKIYNALGMELTTLVNETKQRGRYEASWDASNFPSGVYFYEMTAGEFTERKKMVLIK